MVLSKHCAGIKPVNACIYLYYIIIASAILLTTKHMGILYCSDALVGKLLRSKTIYFCSELFDIFWDAIICFIEVDWVFFMGEFLNNCIISCVGFMASSLVFVVIEYFVIVIKTITIPNYAVSNKMFAVTVHFKSHYSQ